jgi:polyphosphate kinase
LLTCDEAVGQDVTELFNYLTTGYRPKRAFRKLLPAPTLLKKALLAKIEREIVVHSAAAPGLIQLKTNALEDADIMAALYRASQAGVKVDLLVRDTCCLRPGLPGVSENIRVVSVIGRFLEHGRIYYFRNGGEEEYFIGSADCMKRNLEGRVEVVIPIEDPLLRKELRTVLDVQLSGNHGEWEMQSDGTYLRLVPECAFKSNQQLLIEQAQTLQKEAGRRRKLRPKGVSRRAAKRLR